MFKLSILDQSPVINGISHSEALRKTIELAEISDKLGFNRYWVSEHHNSESFASASPEILLTAIASVTKSMRAGSGGVLINHYSPFKIAEQFNLLESLFPGRIDLGIGRAPGGDAGIVKALKSMNSNAFDKTDELIKYMHNSHLKKKFNNVIAVPSGTGIPEIWILGTSPESAVYAAKNGLRYAFGAFINDEFMLQCFQAYYQNFRPSEFLKQPYLNLALFVICGETDKDAERMSRCSEYWLVHTFLKGKDICFPDEETALKYNFSFEEKMLIEYRRNSALIGNPGMIKNKLTDMAEKYAVHEFTIVTITSENNDRINSYKLIANQMLDN